MSSTLLTQQEEEEEEAAAAAAAPPGALPVAPHAAVLPALLQPGPLEVEEEAQQMLVKPD